MPYTSRQEILGTVPTDASPHPRMYNSAALLKLPEPGSKKQHLQINNRKQKYTQVLVFNMCLTL